MNGHKVYTVVWFESNVRHERAFLSEYEARRFQNSIPEQDSWIETDWLEPNISY